jgi:hypothetical protein
MAGMAGMAVILRVGRYDAIALWWQGGNVETALY